MLMKRLLPLFLSSLLALPLLAQTYTDARGWRFTLVDGEAHITGHDTPAATLSGALDVPAQVSNAAGTYPVVSVTGFRGYKALTSLSLPGTLKRIGNYAFLECSGLQGDLAIPQGVGEIGGAAFYGCTSLDGVLSLPAGLTTIGSSAFFNCTRLTGRLELPQGLTRLGYRAFRNCRSLTGDVRIPDGVPGWRVPSFKGAAVWTVSSRCPRG